MDKSPVLIIMYPVSNARSRMRKLCRFGEAHRGQKFMEGLDSAWNFMVQIQLPIFGPDGRQLDLQEGLHM